MSSSKLRVGEPAPRFDLVDACTGERVALASKANRPLLLSFFRYASCAVCNLRLHGLIERFPSYRAAHLRVVAVFESTPERVRQAMATQRPPFAIVADPGGMLYDRYGVERSPEKVERTMADPGTASFVRAAAALGFPLARDPESPFDRIPADFLIGSDGIVRAAHYGELVTDHLPFDELERLLAVPSRPARDRRLAGAVRG